MGESLALPVINDLVQQVKETPDNRNAVHAMLAAILNNYYPRKTASPCPSGRTETTPAWMPSCTASRVTPAETKTKTETETGGWSSICM